MPVKTYRKNSIANCARKSKVFIEFPIRLRLHFDILPADMWVHSSWRSIDECTLALSHSNAENVIRASIVHQIYDLISMCTTITNNFLAIFARNVLGTPAHSRLTSGGIYLSLSDRMSDFLIDIFPAEQFIPAKNHTRANCVLCRLSILANWIAINRSTINRSLLLWNMERTNKNKSYLPDVLDRNFYF